ncbi:serine protease [Pandoraea sp. ISTKB]|uniref:S1 family peptidase n=1 Tax=Pandoraea sp. ISTKB TaxID=1586708 RepID=UPI0009F6C816|nr:serine protease [Pandoraea sp. ISTKB]
MFNKLYEVASTACGLITVFLDGEQISSGTGFAINPEGEVLTAAHVVTGRFPIRHEDYTCPGLQIFCKFPGHPVIEFSVVFCGITIAVTGLSRPLQIDLASLRPTRALSQPVPFLRACILPPRLGDRVFVAGYSDEQTVPFEVNRFLPGGGKGVAEFLAAMEKGYMADMTGPLIKAGFVGNLRRSVAEGAAGSIECEVFYVDNSVHSGASGGPILNENGDAVGVITQRAITSVSQPEFPRLNIPSGCTVGIGLQPLAFVAARN